MSCPFAVFNRPAGLWTSPAARDPLTSGPTTAPLSQHLRKGTAAAHAAIERSPGVKLLLASATSETKALVKRLDYVRWLVMLHALYSTIEAALFTLASPAGQQTAQRLDPVGLALLTPLLQASGGDLLRALARTPALAADIKVHAALTEEEEGTSLADVADALELDQDDGPDAPAASSPAARALGPLLSHVWKAQSHVQPGATGDPTELQTQLSWLDILTPAQKEATGGYVLHIAALAAQAGIGFGLSDAQLRAAAAFPPPEGEDVGGAAKSGALLTHAYTRYLGDLSGGQFIAKHVSNKWPSPAPAPGTEQPDGLEFYHFLSHPNALGQRLAGDPPALWLTDAAAKGRAERALKAAYRAASDGGLEYALIVSTGVDRVDLIRALVDSAALAFLLNGALFDSLAGLGPDQNGPGSAAEAIARANARRPPDTDVRGDSVLPPGHPPVKPGLLGLPPGHPPVKPGLLGLPPASCILALLPIALGVAAVSWRVGQAWSASPSSPASGLGHNTTTLAL